MRQPRITYDSFGTPAVWAENISQAYFGIGFLHGFHRALQTLILASAGRGELARRLIARKELVAIDAIAARLNIVDRAAKAQAELSTSACDWLSAYVDGVGAGLARAGKPFELKVLLAKIQPPNTASVLGASMLAAYLGLAEGQERMERAIIDAVRAGADIALLEAMFHPHLLGWQPEQYHDVNISNVLGFASGGLCVATGGSNAWAVSGKRSVSGKPLFAADPHLQVNQMPSLFFELRVKLPNDYWLGATIPGLPGIAVGRNKNVAWSGTFGVADNVDFTIEDLTDLGAKRGNNNYATVLTRHAKIHRRWRRDLHLYFHETDHGIIESNSKHIANRMLATRWAGGENLANAITAYMALPLATNVNDAEKTIRQATTFSLHYILADRSGEVLYCQAGRIPKRSGQWSGLYPVEATSKQKWIGYYQGETLPRCWAQKGVIASANEARLASDGTTLSTFAQPDYRFLRIESFLIARENHDVNSMKELQLDVFSRQAQLLQPFFISILPDGPIHDALIKWDFCYDGKSFGAHAFELTYQAAQIALAVELGGDWFVNMLAHSELALWWCNAIDRIFAQPNTWQTELGEKLRAAIGKIAQREIQPLALTQRFTMNHMVFGGIPLSGFDKGPFALPGSRATVCQGTITYPGNNQIVIAPAYRFVCDLNEDAAQTCLPGGIEGSRFSDSYDRWLDDYFAGTYHRLEPPRDDEEALY